MFTLISNLSGVREECRNTEWDAGKWESGSVSFYPYAFNAMWTYYKAINDVMEKYGPLMPTVAYNGV